MALLIKPSAKKKKNTPAKDTRRAMPCLLMPQMMGPSTPGLTVEDPEIDQ
jgi:hypothetical protein